MDYDDDEEEGYVASIYATISFISVNKDSPGWCCSARLSLGILGFCGFLSMTSQRVSMSVALVCMLNHTALSEQAVASGSGGILRSGGDSAVMVSSAEAAAAGLGDNATEFPSHITSMPHDCGELPWIFPANLTLLTHTEGKYAWSRTQQTVVAATYYWGYLLVQVPAGWLASRYGGRLVLTGFMLVSSACTTLIPIATRTHYFILILLRFIGGIGAGGIIPGMYAVWGRWAPPDERTRLLSLCFGGSMLSHVATYPIAALLCQFGFDGGWPSIFYLLGGVGVLWAIVWVLFVNDSPTTHPRISKEERAYIVESLAGEADYSTKSEFVVPWVSFLTSMPFLSIVISSFTFDWAFYTLENSFPEFMKNALQYDIKQDPVLSSMPYCGLWFLIVVTGLWSDKLRSRGIISTTTTRKIMQGLGSLAPAALMVGMGFLQCGQAIGGVSMFILGLSLLGFQFSGAMVNILDIGPRYAGVMYGVSSSLGAIAGVVAPIVVDFITVDNTPEQWQTVFFISASLLVFGACVFTIFASGDLQEWAYCDNDDNDSDVSSYTDSYTATEARTEPDRDPDDDEDDEETSPDSDECSIGARSTEASQYGDAAGSLPELPESKDETPPASNKPRSRRGRKSSVGRKSSGELPLMRHPRMASDDEAAQPQHPLPHHPPRTAQPHPSGARTGSPHDDPSALPNYDTFHMIDNLDETVV